MDLVVGCCESSDRRINNLALLRLLFHYANGMRNPSAQPHLQLHLHSPSSMVNLPSIKGSKARAAAAAAASSRKAPAPKVAAPEPKAFKPPYDKKNKSKGRPAKQLNFMDSDAESDGSGYDVAPSTNFADDGMDISSSLVAGPSGVSRAEAAEEEVDEDEDEIMELMGKKAVKDATAAVKEVVGKGKGKESKGTTGGGSWQSMGES